MNRPTDHEPYHSDLIAEEKDKEETMESFSNFVHSKLSVKIEEQLGNHMLSISSEGSSHRILLTGEGLEELATAIEFYLKDIEYEKNPQLLK